MITPAQEKWLSHLSDTNSTEILPYDPESPRKFNLFKKQVQSALGERLEIFHKGASSLGISGQGELDVYVPVSSQDFDRVVDSFTGLFGEPGSVYPLKRARFNSECERTKVELFVINKEDEGWLNSCKFEEYLKSYPKALEEYRILKEEGKGLSTQKYYRRKLEFINDILSRKN